MAEKLSRILELDSRMWTALGPAWLACSPFAMTLSATFCYFLSRGDQPELTPYLFRTWLVFPADFLALCFWMPFLLRWVRARRALRAALDAKAEG